MKKKFSTSVLLRTSDALCLAIAGLVALAPSAKPQRNELGATPLHNAVWSGSAELVESLIAHGADVNARHLEGGSTPLDYAIVRDRPDIAKLLIGGGADVNAPTPRA